MKILNLLIFVFINEINNTKNAKNLELNNENSIYNLPRSFMPEMINLKIFIKSEESTFDGETQLKIICKEETNEMHLHGIDLEIISFFFSFSQFDNNKTNLNLNTKINDNDYYTNFIQVF